jgi:excisionase family DNA binding protein
MTAPPDAAAAPAPLAYRVRDAARASGISRSGLYRLARAGKLRLVRVGRRTLIPAAALRALLADGAGAPKREGA